VNSPKAVSHRPNLHTLLGVYGSGQALGRHDDHLAGCDKFMDRTEMPRHGRLLDTYQRMK
jgi:hypothetical protein